MASASLWCTWRTLPHRWTPDPAHTRARFSTRTLHPPSDPAWMPFRGEDPMNPEESPHALGRTTGLIPTENLPLGIPPGAHHGRIPRSGHPHESRVRSNPRGGAGARPG